MWKYISLAVVAITSSGCELQNKIPELSKINANTIPVVKSVAEKALGAEAYFVDPFTRSGISTPGIYKILKTGRYIRLCTKDFREQTALIEMKSNTSRTKVAQVIEDSLSPVRIKIKVLGHPYELPYKKVRVSGYEIQSSPSGSSETAEQFILDNVYKNCPDVLKRNKPYFIVTEVAVADSVETITGGGLAEINFDVPIPTINSKIEVQLKDDTPERKTNAIFAMRGRYIRQ